MSWVQDAEKAYELSLLEEEERQREELCRIKPEEEASLAFFESEIGRAVALLGSIKRDLNSHGYAVSLDKEWRHKPFVDLLNDLRLHPTTHSVKMASGEEKPAHLCLVFKADSVRVVVSVCDDGETHHLYLEVVDGVNKLTRGYVLDWLDQGGETSEDVVEFIKGRISTLIASGRYNPGSIM